jgi:Family of unknown function (DUF6279)
MHRLWTWLLLLLLQGCSTLQFGYNQAPQLGYWWLDSQLSLEDAQSELARDALRRLQRWHRHKELLAYADLLQKLQEMSTSDVDAEQVCEVWMQVDEAMDRAMAQAIRLAAPLTLQLQPRQLRHLARHWDEKNEDWEQQWLRGKPEERLSRRLDRSTDRYKDFYGKLSEAQIALLRTQIQRSVWTPEWGRQERLRRQQLLLATLQRLQLVGASTAQAELALQAVWQQWLQPPVGPHQQRHKRWVNQSCKDLAELHNSTNMEQRQRAARQLRDYETDLRELAQPH